MNFDLLLSPPIAFIIFLGILSLVYVFIRKKAAKGLDHPEKYLPYSGGQKIAPIEVRLSYEAFFRISLLFGIAHVSVLVLATFSLWQGPVWPGLIYLASISISALVLSRSN